MKTSAHLNTTAAIANASAKKLNRLWFCVFLLYGFRISPNRTHRIPGCFCKTLKCLIFTSVQVTLFIAEILYWTLRLTDTTTTSTKNRSVALNVVTYLVYPLITIVGAINFVYFCWRETRFCLILKKLVASIAKYKSGQLDGNGNGNGIWKEGLTHVIFIFLHGVINLIFEIHSLLSRHLQVQISEKLNQSISVVQPEPDGFEGYFLVSDPDSKLTITDALSLSQNDSTSTPIPVNGIVMSVTWTYTSLIFNALAIAFFVYICKLLSINFHILGQRAEVIQKSGRSTALRVKNLHIRHHEICNWTNEVNKLFSPLLLMWNLITIITSCCIIRSLLNDHLNNVAALLLLLIRDVILSTKFFLTAAAVKTEAVQAALKIAALTDEENDGHNRVSGE